MRTDLSRLRPAGRWMFLLMVVLGSIALTLLPGVGGKSARAAGDVGYMGPSYAGAGGSPSGSKPESKLWWNDGFWWASIWHTGSSSFHIFRLDQGSQTWVDTGTVLDTRSGSRADALWDGAKLYVASHGFTESAAADTAGRGRLWRFSYDSGANSYSLDSGFPVDINQAKTETLVIDKDTAGKLWATWVQKDSGGQSKVFVNRTLGSDSTWGTPFVMLGTGTTVTSDDISSVIAYDGNKIGIMWSNQSDRTMNFSTHIDGQPDTTWESRSIAYGGTSDPDADDHINLKSLQTDGQGRVFAAVKTSRSSSSEPLVVLLVYNRVTNQWSSAVYGTVADHHTRPIVMLDTTNNVIHMFATSDENGGSIYEKTTPIALPSFITGRGTPFIEEGATPGISGDLNNATSSKHNVNCTTGLVVLATNDTTDRYWHNYKELPGCGTSAPNAGFSGTPTAGSAPLTVSFTDQSTGAPTGWAWDFGDGGTSTVQHPTHVYAAPGTYTVSLTATNANGSDTETRANYITVSVASPTVTFNAVEDAYVKSDSATSNYGSASTLRVRTSSSSQLRSYLKFDVAGLTGSVVSSKLRVFVTDPSTGGGSAFVSAGSGWSEGTVNWNNQPGTSGSALATAGAVSNGNWVEFDLGGSVIGNGTYSFVLSGGTSDVVYYSSSEASSNRPQLVVTVSSGPTAPTAGFSGTPTSGTTPLTVNFTDQSTGAPTNWAWDFDNDGTVDSTAQNPSFTYNTAGTYTVKLTATNSTGSDDEVKTNYITVSTVTPTLPVANFSGTPTSGLAPLTVSFTDQSTGAPTGWAWDFDNNGTVDSTAQNPSFTYNTAGTYTVKLTATNSFGSDDEIKTNYITASTGGGTAPVTLLPNGDGTSDTVIKPSGTTSLFQAIDETLAASDDSTTYIRNNNAASGRSFALLGDTPANFGGMSALSVDVRARTVGRVDDTTTLYAQIYKGDEATPLSDEVIVAINPGPSGWITLANITFTGVVPGTKADWDGARLRLRWAHSAAGSADSTQIRVTVVEVDGTYITAGP